MLKKVIIIILLIMLVVLGGGVAWSIVQANNTSIPTNNQQQATGKQALTQTDKQGAVEATLTWLNPSRNENNLKMDVKLNTHSVDLNKYDLVQNAEVFVDDRQISSKFSLTTQGEGHHIQNILTIPGVNLKQAKTVKLMLKNLDNIPSRTFIWDLQQAGIK